MRDFVPYEEALALNQLGLDEPYLLHIQYSSGTDIFTGRKFKNSIWLGNGYDAEIGNEKIKYKFPKHSKQSYGTLGIPTFSQAFRFFREKYKLQAEILWRGDMSCFCYKTGEFKYGSHDFSKDDYKTYEQAELECLRQLIKIAKDEQRNRANL